MDKMIPIQIATALAGQQQGNDPLIAIGLIVGITLLMVVSVLVFLLVPTSGFIEFIQVILGLLWLPLEFFLKLLQLLQPKQKKSYSSEAVKRKRLELSEQSRFLALVIQLKDFFPEDSIAELGALLTELNQRRMRKWVVFLILSRQILGLFWAFYVQIKIDNLKLNDVRDSRNLRK